LKKDWRDSVTGITAMHNILLMHLFDRLMGIVPYQKQGFYLCENQGWERAFVYAWRKHGHGRIIGVGHATIRYWDLRYFDATIATVVPDLPRPDALAVNGPAAWFNLQKAGQPMEQCVRVEALRYVNLYKIRQDSEKNLSTRIGKRRLLVLGDIQWETTHRMMLILEHLHEKLDVSHEVWVKPHSHNQIELKNYPKLKAIYMDSPLKELLTKIDVTLASVFTSGELDSYCLGVPVIHYLDPHNLNFSNLREAKNTKFISTTEELSEALKHIELGKCKTGKPGDFFWLDPKLPKWKALLEGKILQQAQNSPGSLNKV
jgi:surface carbohydrate biosynthesis protein (TIGR04326 family)